MPAPTPILDFLTRFRLLAYTLVFLACAAFAQAENNPSTFILSCAAIVLSWWLVESSKGREIPRVLLNFGVLSAAGILFYELVLKTDDQLNLLRSLGHFMILILLCKLFERKTNRDYAQILTLTLLIIVAAAISSLSVVFAIILAVYLALGLYTMLLFFLRTEIHAAAAAKIIPSEHAIFLRPDPTIRKDFRRISSLAAVLLLGLATFIFLSFPRSRATDFLGWNANSGNYRTGFSDHVQMYDQGHLQPSEAIVMEVKIEEDGANLGSEDNQPYFRGMTLDTYDPNQHLWIHNAQSDIETPSETYYSLDANSHDADLITPSQYQSIGMTTQSYTLYAPSANILFTVNAPVRIHSEEKIEGGFSDEDNTLYATNNSFPLHYAINSAIIYTPAVQPTPHFTMPLDVSPLEQDFVLDAYNHVPVEVRRLAHELARDLLPKPGHPLTEASTRAIADRFLIYLQQTYPYSLDFTAVDPNLDPTADFLLNRKTIGGHCEYFASAMVMLCRSVGINARMVIGYHGGDFNTLGGYYSVKQKFAHAWTEVVIPNHGWVRFDPSPSSSIPDSGTTFGNDVSHWFHDLFDIVQRNWQATVVAFDNSSRTYLFGTIANFFSSIAHGITAYIENFLLGFRDLAYDTSYANRFTALITTAVILALLFWLLRHWHRRRNSQVEHILRKLDKKAQRQLAHDLLFFDDLLRLLAKTGCRKLPEQTPREYVDRIAPALGQSSTDARWLVATFYDIRFGALRLTPPLRDKIAASLHHLRQHFA